MMATSGQSRWRGDRSEPGAGPARARGGAALVGLCTLSVSVCLANGPIGPACLAGGDGAIGKAGRRDAQAEAVLAGRGVIRQVGGQLVLQAEGALTDAMGKLRDEGRAFQVAGRELALTTQAAAQLDQINEAITAIDADVAQLRFEMNQYPTLFTQGRVLHGSNFGENAAFEQLRQREQGLLRERNSSLNPTRERLQRLAPKANLDRVTRQLADRRQRYRAALDGAKQAAESATRAIDELNQDAAVKPALARLGLLALQPSPGLAASIREVSGHERALGQPFSPDPPARKSARRGRS